MSNLLPLQIQNLSFRVGNKQLLHQIEATITHQGICVIMGHNGAGKSLLLKCLHGLLVPDSGSISWAGNDATSLTTKHRQAMVLQKPLMLNRSVAANINYVLKLRGRPTDLCMQYLKSANLEHQSTQAARSLSGGEQQRLAIARAMATQPEVLFLDEPTANLDPTATSQIESQILKASHQSIKTVLVTHDIAQARRLSDEILFLHAGKLTEHTPANHFFNQPQSNEATEFLAAYTGSKTAL